MQRNLFKNDPWVEYSLTSNHPSISLGKNCVSLLTTVHLISPNAGVQEFLNSSKLVGCSLSGSILLCSGITHRREYHH